MREMLYLMRVDSYNSCMNSSSMNSGKMVADGTGRVNGEIEGSTRGPRGPNNCRLGILGHP